MTIYAHMYIYGHYSCNVYNILYVHIILYYNIYSCVLRTMHSHRVLLTMVLRMFMNYIKGTCSVMNLMQPSTQLQCIIRYCLAECMLMHILPTFVYTYTIPVKLCHNFTYVYIAHADMVIMSHNQLHILYSGKISRTINFAVLEDFTIYSLEN